MLLFCRRAEHDYLSQKANEERKNRPQYTHIIEHDGLPCQRSCGQVLTNSNLCCSTLICWDFTPIGFFQFFPFRYSQVILPILPLSSDCRFNP